MKKFERPSLDEVQQLGRRLHRKSVVEIIALLGQPARELGRLLRIERRYSGHTETRISFRVFRVFRGYIPRALAGLYLRSTEGLTL